MTTPTSDEVAGLISTLRDGIVTTQMFGVHSEEGQTADFPATVALMSDAADALQSLIADKESGEAMREALKPFATYFDEGGDRDNHGNPLPDEQGVGWVYLTIGDFRRSRAALQKAST